ATSPRESGNALPFSSVISFANRSASRMISSKALRRISARSRGFRPAQPSKASSAASSAALASSTVALATEAILRSVAGSITSKRLPSEALRHLPPIQRSVGTLARRFSYIRLTLHSQLSWPGLSRSSRLAARRLSKRGHQDRPGDDKELTPQAPSHRFGNAIRRRQYNIFQNVRRRQGMVRVGDSDRRAIEIVEGLIRRNRYDLGTPSA